MTSFVVIAATYSEIIGSKLSDFKSVQTFVVLFIVSSALVTA